VDSNFGSLSGGWCSLEPVGAFGVGLWKNIRIGWETFSGFSRFKVGDRARTKFWHDLWCRDSVLKEAFLSLFGIARAKNASVAENLEFLSGSNQWNMSFSREAHDWEVDVFASFFQVFHTVFVRRGSEDRLWWVSSKRGLFNVKSFFNSLAGSEGSCFSWKSACQTWALLRVVFFEWSVALGMILTLDNLRKMQAIMVNRCCMCKRSG
jgi:hypothetical protein